MSAYKIALSLYCDHSGCVLRARWLVCNGRREATGRYCNKHADKHVRSLDSEEDVPGYVRTGVTDYEPEAPSDG